jgi:hypothetical protein
MCSDGMRDFSCEVRPRLEHVPVPRNQLAMMPTHVCKRSEPIDLRLEDKRRMIERLGNAQQPHRGMRSTALCHRLQFRFVGDPTSAGPGTSLDSAAFKRELMRVRLPPLGAAMSRVRRHTPRHTMAARTT